jgi:hypothetical protein
MSLHFLHGSATRPCAGFTSCGDATAVVRAEHGSLYLVIDALGHGPDAEKSAQAACVALQTLSVITLAKAFAAVDHALAGMREVVMAGLQLDPGAGLFAGVGNVEVLGPPEVSRPVSQVGRVGRGLRPLRVVPVPLPLGARWVLASDGLRPRLLRSAWEATLALPPAEAAQRFLELAGRDDDDASALVVELQEAP